MLETMTKAKEIPKLSVNSELNLYAFMIRGNAGSEEYGNRRLELTYGKSLEEVEKALSKKYGTSLDSFDVSLVGGLPASDMISPMVEDLFYVKLEEAQKTLDKLNRMAEFKKKEVFIGGLQLAVKHWGTNLTKTDKADLSRILVKLGK